MTKKLPDDLAATDGRTGKKEKKKNMLGPVMCMFMESF